jgi:multiple sugar transport system permease protein
MTRTGRTGVHWSQLGLHAALAVAGVCMLLPFGWMVLTAVTPEDQVLDPSILPGALTLENFRVVLETVPIWRYYLNGLIITAAIFLGQVMICVPAAYALARLRFAGAALSLWVVLACLVVPPQVIALPLYFVFSEIGWLDTWQVLIVPFLASAFGVFLMRCGRGQPVGLAQRHDWPSSGPLQLILTYCLSANCSG